jgi:hypothetical protein
MVNFIVSGTGLFLDAVNEVLSSGVGKQAAKKFDVFHDVGSFNTEKSQRAYWDQYVPQAFLTSSSTGIETLLNYAPLDYSRVPVHDYIAHGLAGRLGTKLD